MSANESSTLRLLTELRQRLLYCVMSICVIFFSLLYFANDLYRLLAKPLLKTLEPGHSLIATNIISPLFVPFELTLITTFFLAVPVFLYQLWAFVVPALYQHERRLIWLLLWVSILLFYVGVAFGYFLILPILFHFLTGTAPQGVMVTPDISQYLDFTLKLLFIFGCLFEVPVVIMVLIWTGAIKRETFRKNRPYAIILAFVMGMLLGPPDVLSQMIIAIPLYLLFEVGVFLSHFLKKRV